MRYTQVKNLGTIEQLRSYLTAVGIDLPIVERVDATGALSTPVSFTDSSAGTFSSPNRFAILPMEGWDATPDGHPTELVRRRWQRIATSGAGLAWCEATAVRHDGRANPHQLLLDESTVDEFAALRALLAPNQIAGLQLTHSGRWSRPDGVPAPRTAYAHPILDERVGASESAILRDDELDELVVRYVDAAVLAHQAGFHFVDVKHCHGYLLHELLSAHGRAGRFGGDLEHRMYFLRTVVAGIRDRAPHLAIAVRLSAFDLIPFVASADGTGAPEPHTGPYPYPYAFGGDGTGLGIDLTETHAFLDAVTELGIGLVSITAGSPYYNPHVQRPAYVPPSDGDRAPEDPLVGVARQLAVTAEITRRHPLLTTIGSGYSYLQDWLPNVGQAVIEQGGASMVGLGRMVLAYPDLPTDVLAGRPLQRGLICRTFSDCTTAPRHGLISGCFPLDPFYKAHPDRVELTQVKKRDRFR